MREKIVVYDIDFHWPESKPYAYHWSKIIYINLTQKINKTRIPRMEFMPTALINQNNK